MNQQQAEDDHWKKHSVPSYDHGSHAKKEKQMSFGFPKKSNKHWQKYSVPSYDHGSHAKSRKDQLKEGMKDIVRKYPKPYYEPATPQTPHSGATERLHPAQLGMKRRLQSSPSSYVYAKDMEEKDAETLPYLKNIDLKNAEHNPNDRRTRHQVLSDKLQQHYVKERDEESPIFRYTQGSYELNHSLINQHKTGQEPMEHFSEHAKELDKELGKHKLPHDMITYSGIKVDKFDPREHMDKDGMMHSPAFMSSSILPNVAQGFARSIERDTLRSLQGKEPTGSDQSEQHIIRFKHKKGDPGTFIEGNTKYEGEHEFLIPRNVKFKFNKTPQTHEDAYGNILHIWDAEVHHPQVEQPAQRDFGFPEKPAPQSSQIDKYNQAMKTKLQNKATQIRESVVYRRY